MSSRRPRDVAPAACVRRLLALAVFSVENPLRREGVLFVSLPHDMVTALRIYNVAGVQVATLQQGQLSAGRHEIRWSGRNGLGGRVSSGMYLAKLETPLRTIARKLLVLQ